MSAEDAPPAAVVRSEDAQAKTAPTGVRRRTLRSWLPAFLIGLAVVPACRLLINNTPLADQLVRPLLLADTSGRADAIVALGASATASCTPNGYSLRRALLAARLFREGRAPLVLFTGGLSGSPRCPVAEVMAGVARDAGVPADAIRVETASTSTWENAAHSAPILRRLGARRVLLVSDKLHMRRAQACFAHLGFHAERASIPVYEGSRDNVDMLYYGLREFVATWYYRYKGWIGDPRAITRASRASSPIGQMLARAAVTQTSRSANPVARETVAQTFRSANPPARAIENQMSEPIKNLDGPVVILGASYAGGWLLAEIAGVPVVNKGVSGQQSFEFLERFENDVVSLRPRSVIIWGFINDIYRAPKDQVERALARARESYVTMVAAARRHGIQPILATEVTVRSRNTLSDTVMTLLGDLLGRSSYQDGINAHVLAMNQWLRDFARREQLLLLDVQPALSESSGRRRKEYAKDDGSHISTAGYDALTRYAGPLLEAHVRGR
jgi:uncharacterized SAM-binding protein YcdF (DUF218 family)/lysophospholipase L1-like esterase